MERFVNYGLSLDARDRVMAESVDDEGVCKEETSVTIPQVLSDP